ncbi:zinc ribbon domain-containing protein [Paenibacillus sp. 1182]|uniref:zinc ribbon domain-containing protein n=1 Tax=Paenibacillus sp. 1182 TaxID=2806565 RepID=UPI0037CACEEF
MCYKNGKERRCRACNVVRIFLRKTLNIWYWRTLKIADPFAPTSQTCHVCGAMNTEVKNLQVRQWTCPSCHTTHDRDENAARNIENVAIPIVM